MRRGPTALAALALAVLAGCSSTPRTPPEPVRVPRPSLPVPLPPLATPDRDGADAHPPPDLHLVPDAEPRIDVVRAGGPNKPYEVLGQSYVPLLGDPPIAERGLASWYGRKFHGKTTSNGEVYDMYAMTAAHKTMPIPSYARVRNPANGREVIVRVNDRGPFHADRIIDLSYTAALKLGVLGGVAPVEVQRITHEAIRTGAWRRGSEDTALAAARPAAPALPALQPPALATEDPIAEIALRESRRPAAPPFAATAEPVQAVGAVAAEARAATPPPGSAAAPAAGNGHGFWLQLGAFRARDGAEGLQRQLAAQAGWLSPLLAIFSDSSLHRLQAGPYATRTEAGAAAERLREALQLAPVLLERR